MSTTTFPAAVVDAVCAHMNDDHPEDCLVIVRGLGDLPDAVSARMVGLDAVAVRFDATLPDGDAAPVRVEFPAPVTERPQIRLGVVRMYEDACAALGMAPRVAEEH